jgi:hypothetical protein
MSQFTSHLPDTGEVATSTILPARDHASRAARQFPLPRGDSLVVADFSLSQSRRVGPH